MNVVTNVVTNEDRDIFSEAADVMWSTSAKYGEIPAREIAILREQNPAWCDAFEECVLDTSDMSHLEDLVHSAPTDYSCGLIYGIILMRVQIAMMTGRHLQWDPDSQEGEVSNTTLSGIKTPNYGARQASEMLKLRQWHSDWYAYFEDCMVDVADRAEIENLLQAAPTLFASGIAYGVIVMRLYMGMLTGRGFS